MSALTLVRAARGERVLELYDDEEHPRGGKGTTTGGQFVKNDNGTPTAKKPQPAKPKQHHSNAQQPKQQSGTIVKKQAVASKPTTKKVAAKKRRKIRRMQEGDSGPKVAQLQAALRKLHIGGKALKLDGKYGPATRAAVMAAQEKLGMDPNGEVSASFLRKVSDAAELSPC